MHPLVDDAGDQARRPLLQNSVARLAADGSGVVLGTVSSIVTARVLGPSSKGTLAALTFVTTIVIQGALMGLGDALVVRVGQAKATLDSALHNSLSAIALSSTLGALLVLGYAVAQLPLDNPYVWPAVVVAGATVTVSCAGQLLHYAVYARHRMVSASVITIVASTVTMIALVVLCGVFDLDVLGGALASLMAAVVLTVAAAITLRRDGIGLGLAWDTGYLRPALHFGLRAQMANLLAYSTARVDLLLVYALTNSATAGRYSVALTIGTLTGFVAVALSYASFPGMAGSSEQDALTKTAELARVAALVALPVAMLMAATTVVIVPLLFGTAYNGSIAPAVVLLFGNVLWGQQWLLSRALAARGDPRVLFWSFAVNLVTMLVVDVALIPELGAMGGAVGSVVAPVAGLAVCARAYAKRGVSPRQFVPGRTDADRVRDVAAAAFRRVTRGAGGS